MAKKEKNAYIHELDILRELTPKSVRPGFQQLKQQQQENPNTVLGK